MKFQELNSKFNTLDEEYNSVMSAIEYRSRLRRDLSNSIEKLSSDIQVQEEYIEKFKMAKKAIQKITDERNKGAKSSIKELVNKGLISILQKHSYNLEIHDDDRGDNQKITDIQLISVETGKPRKVGTAVKQVTSLIFIISLLEIAQSSKFIILDEYLSGASGETADKLSNVLAAIAENNNFQFFVVNHVLDISNNPDVERIYLENMGEEIGLVVDKDKTEREKQKRKLLKEQEGYGENENNSDKEQT